LESRCLAYTPQRLPLKKLDERKFAALHARAQRAFSKYAALLETVPSAALLSSLIIPEAMASLESQKVTSSIQDVCIALLQGNRAKQSLKQVVNYIRAFDQGRRLIDQRGIDKEMLCILHRYIKRGAKHSAERGQYRTRQNWIGPERCTRAEAHFLPPAPTQVAATMRNLLSYCRRAGYAPLLQTAIAFAQLLIIHPFMDGNGRVGRLLVPMLLYQKRAIAYPYFFLSRYFKDHRLKYFESLFNLTASRDWEAWVCFFFQGVIRESRRGYKTLSAILNLHKRLSTRHSEKLLHFLFAHPLFRTADFLKRFSRAELNALMKEGVVHGSGGFYALPELLHLLQNHRKRKNPGIRSRGP